MSIKQSMRIRIILTSLILLALLTAIVLSVRAEQGTFASVQADKLLKAPDNTAVTTYHNDNQRTGQNLNESTLNMANVNANQFGKRMSYPVDGQISTQPLFVPNVKINDVKHNAVYVATENDSVYAFDADQTAGTAPLWQSNFLINGATTVPASDVYTKYPNKDINPQIGITGTPVIDLKTNSLFVVVMTKENGQYFERLHALSIKTGAEKPGSPQLIQASVPGHGYDSVNGITTFKAVEQNQRAALLLSNGVIYIAWAAFGDTDTYHGWVMGYTYNGKAFKQVSVYNDTPDGQEGGIWMSGSGPATDQYGNLYLTTGNGTFDLPTSGGRDAGDSFIKLTTQHDLQQSDFFTPFNQNCLDGRDADLGSAGVVLLPDQPNPLHPHLLLGTGKEGRLYLIDRDNMGKYTTDPSLQCNTAEERRTDIDKVVQELPPGSAGSLFGTPGYWSGSDNRGPFVYFGGFQDHLRAFSLGNASLSNSPTSTTSETFAFSGATPSISSNGHVNGTGIVWIISPSTCSFPGCTPGGSPTLRAYDATNLANEIYNSDQNATRDQLDSYMKFSLPTITHGEVFVGTRTSLTIYGLLPAPASHVVTIDDNARGIGLNQFNFIGEHWDRCSHCDQENIGMYNASNTWSRTPNTYGTFAFIGTQISLYAVKRPTNGIVAFFIDGANETLVDLYSATSSGNQLVWTSPTLSTGPHILKIRVTGTKNTNSPDTYVCIDRADITH